LYSRKKDREKERQGGSTVQGEGAHALSSKITCAVIDVLCIVLCTIIDIIGMDIAASTGTLDTRVFS